MSYIVIEGPDYAGKTTLIENIKQKLESEGTKVVVVREPGGTPLAEKLRDMVRAGEATGSSDCEMFLMLAARSDLFYRCVLPALEEGAVVIGDRGTPSTFAYQCRDDVSRDMLRRYKKIAMPLNPMYIFLELSYEEYTRRKQERGAEDAIEARYDTQSKFESLLCAYRAAREIEPRTVMINVDNKTPEQVCAEAMPYVVNAIPFSVRG